MNFLASIPDFEAWKQGHQSLEDAQDSFCYINRRVAHFLCAIPIFWPEFILKDDLLLRKDAIPPNWEEFLKDATSANWSPSQIEYVINHIHVTDLFMRDPSYEQLDVGIFDFLATTIADMWQRRAQSLYPERSIQVEINDKGVSPEVGIYTVRPGDL